jgi:hypothetical protein
LVVFIRVKPIAGNVPTKTPVPLKTGTQLLTFLACQTASP